MKKRIMPFLLLVLILGTLISTAMASDYEIMPCYNNTMGTSTNFVISSTGEAEISITYDAYQDYFTSATITSYIEKRTLGLFWTRVDIGQPNNEWVDTSTRYYNAFGHTIQLPSTGTYRATVVYEINGTGGAADVIDFDKTLTYS